MREARTIVYFRTSLFSNSFADVSLWSDLAGLQYTPQALEIRKKKLL